MDNKTPLMQGTNMKNDIQIFLENPSRKFKFYWNMTRITDILHKNQYAFLISSSIFLRMRNASDQSCRENQ